MATPGGLGLEGLGGVPPSQLLFPHPGPLQGVQEAVASCLGPLVNFSFPGQAG